MMSNVVCNGVPIAYDFSIFALCHLAAHLSLICISGARVSNAMHTGSLCQAGC